MNPTKTLAAKLVDRIYARSNGAELTLEQLGLHAVHMAVEDCQGNMSEAGKALGLDRTTVYRKMKEKL